MKFSLQCLILFGKIQSNPLQKFCKFLKNAKQLYLAEVGAVAALQSTSVSEENTEVSPDIDDASRVR